MIDREISPAEQSARERVHERRMAAGVEILIANETVRLRALILKLHPAALAHPYGASLRDLVQLESLARNRAELKERGDL